MTARDRTVLMILAAVGVVAAFWFLAITPKRKAADEAATQLKAAQQRLDVARSSAATAAAAKARYDSDYAVVARLGKAVPVEDDVPSLVYQLQTLASAHHVDFRGIKLAQSSSAAAPTTATAQAAAVASATGTTPASSASVVPAALPPGATVGAAGFPTMPFTFDFRGSYFDMQHFLRAINGLTSVDGKSINVSGRLLSVDGVGLQAAPKGFPEIEATVAATAYLLPADEGLTGGATATGPDGATATASTTSSTSAAPASALIGSDK